MSGAAHRDVIGADGKEDRGGARGLQDILVKALGAGPSVHGADHGARAEKQPVSADSPVDEDKPPRELRAEGVGEGPGSAALLGDGVPEDDERPDDRRIPAEDLDVGQPHDRRDQVVEGRHPPPVPAEKLGACGKIAPPACLYDGGDPVFPSARPRQSRCSQGASPLGRGEGPRSRRRPAPPAAGEGGDSRQNELRGSPPPPFAEGPARSPGALPLPVGKAKPHLLSLYIGSHGEPLRAALRQGRSVAHVGVDNAKDADPSLIHGTFLLTFGRSALRRDPAPSDPGSGPPGTEGRARTSRQTE